MAHHVHRLIGSNFQPVHILLNKTITTKKKGVVGPHKDRSGKQEQQHFNFSCTNHLSYDDFFTVPHKIATNMKI